MSLEIEGELVESVTVGGGLTFGNGVLGVSPTLPGSYTVAGAVSVGGAVDAASVEAPALSGAAAAFSGQTATPPFFAGTQGAAVTWNATPPTVAGGAWNVGADGGDFAFVNQLGLGSGGYAFWDGRNGGPFKLLATINGAASATPGAMTVAGGFVSKNNTLDDGTGNASISGAVTLGGELTAGANVGANALALSVKGGAQALQAMPNAGAGASNPITQAGDVLVTAAGSVLGGAPLALVPWSGTKSGLRLLPSGEVLSAENALDDGAGNATIAGALTPYAIGARGFVYDIRAAGVPVDGVTDAIAALNALFANGVAAEFFFPAGTTVLVAGTVTLPDAPITCRGVYGLSQIHFSGAGQFLSDNANSASGVHPQHKFAGISFVVGGSVPALEYNWSAYSQPVTTGAQEASIVFRDCGFFATTAATTSYLVSLSNIAQMLFDNCAGYATYGSGSSAADAPAQCVIGAFGSSTGGLTLNNCRFNGWSRAPILYVNGNGQTPNFQGVTLTNTTLMSNGASMGLVAIDVTGLILADSYIDYCCQNVIFQGDDFYASNCWISYSPSPNNQAVTPSSGATVTYPSTNASNLTIQGSATLAALTVELPVPAWQGVACSITFEVAVSALTVTAPSGYTVNTYPGSVSAGQTITFYFNVAVPNNDTWYELASGGPAAIMFQGPRNNFSNLHVQAYAPSVSTDPATIAYGALALGPSSLNWSGGDASVGLVSAVYEPQFNDASFIPSTGFGIVGVGGVPFQVVQSLFTMNSGGSSNGPFAIAAGNALYTTDVDLPSGAPQTTQTFHAPAEFVENVGVGSDIVFNASTGEGAFQNVVAQASVVGAAAFFDSIAAQTSGPTIQGNAPFQFNSPVTMANALYLTNALVGNPAIQSQPVVSPGTWAQNTSGGPLWVALTAILGANASVNLFASATEGGAEGVDLSNFNNGGSSDMTVTVAGPVPAGWWWIVSTSGTVTLNSSSYPNGSVRVI